MGALGHPAFALARRAPARRWPPDQRCFYNANPLSTAAALEHLAERGRLAPEGGRPRGHGRAGDSGSRHRQVGAVAPGRASPQACRCRAARAGLPGGRQRRGVPETRRRPLTPGLAALRAVVRSGDRVLVKGSRVMCLEAVADVFVVTYV